MTDGTSYDRRPEGRWSGDFGDAGILLTDTPTNFRPRKTQTRRGDDSTNQHVDYQSMTEP